MRKPVVLHHRVLWEWCVGHRLYEIAAIERLMGSEAFEARVLELWNNSTSQYRVTTEDDPLHYHRHIWTHQ